ncbi:MAG: hypothetical protein H6589_00830 [Flavobacteriales bacterium]|nr:hypothetical protein [Flavobacteriales bacterium]
MRAIVFILALICVVLFWVFPVITTIFRIGSAPINTKWWQNVLGLIGFLLVIGLWNDGNVDGKKDKEK